MVSIKETFVFVCICHAFWRDLVNSIIKRNCEFFHIVSLIISAIPIAITVSPLRWSFTFISAVKVRQIWLRLKIQGECIELSFVCLTKLDHIFADSGNYGLLVLDNAFPSKWKVGEFECHELLCTCSIWWDHPLVWIPVTSGILFGCLILSYPEFHCRIVIFSDISYLSCVKIEEDSKILDNASFF